MVKYGRIYERCDLILLQHSAATATAVGPGGGWLQIRNAVRSRQS